MVEGEINVKIKAILLGILTLTAGAVIGGQTLTAQAAMTTDQILQTAPKGITIDNYFSTGNIPGNIAKVGDTDFGKNQAVVLTTKQNQVGAIWTSDDARMNLNEDETASMWMYFGDGRGTSGGDGMAFVMQNDPAGVNAIAKKADGTPNAGQTLGVWGSDSRTNLKNNTATNDNDLDTNAVAKLAIQDSWALEFDTYLNKNTKLNNNTDALAVLKAGNVSAFDQTETGNHIASSFPGKSGSYNKVVGATDPEQVQTGTGIFGLPLYTTVNYNYSYLTLNHEGVLRDSSFTFLNGGTWRHMTLKWDSSKDEMTYVYNDRPPVSGEETASTGSYKTYTSDPIHINPADLKVGSDGKVRWGFTGSTGSSWEPNMVVFDQVPGLVNAKAAATLTDTSQSDKIIDEATDTVNSGDRMSLNYNLKYTSGRESWKDIVAKLNLPSNIAFKSAKVKYANGDTDTISGLDTSNTTGQTLSKSLENLNTEKDGDTDPNASVDITLAGVAVAGDNDQTTVKQTDSSFDGSNALTSASLSGFVINKVDGAMTMALTGDNIAADGLTGSQTLTEAKDVKITGKISYLTGTPATNNNITLHPQMNGISLPPTTLSNDDPAGEFTYTIPANSIISGLANGNQFVMYATDNNGVNSANDVGYTITLKDGSLDLLANPKATFNVDHPKDLTGSAMTYAADSSWGVQVSDTRGTGSKWALTAQADPIVSRLRGTLDGDLVYVDGNGKQQSLTQGSAVIDTQTTDADNDQVNVTGDWNSNKGIVLKTNAGAVWGPYSTVVHWTLSDAPK